MQILQEVLYIRDGSTLLPEHHVEAGDEEEEEQPEPEGDEDLVIDHVDWENTEAVKSNTEIILSPFKWIGLDTFEYFLKLHSSESYTL